MRFNLNLKNIFIGLFILFILLSAMSGAGQPNLGPEKSLSTVITEVKGQKVSQIEVEDTKLTIFYKDGTKATSRKEPQESLIQILQQGGVDPNSVEIKVKDLSVGQIWMSLLTNVLPLVLTVIFFLFIFLIIISTIISLGVYFPHLPLPR